MTQIFHLPNEIKQEFFIDEEGKAYASQRATARMAGVSKEAIRKLLIKLDGNLEPPKILESYAGQNFKGVTYQIS